MAVAREEDEEEAARAARFVFFCFSGEACIGVMLRCLTGHQDEESSDSTMLETCLLLLCLLSVTLTTTSNASRARARARAETSIGVGKEKQARAREDISSNDSNYFAQAGTVIRQDQRVIVFQNEIVLIITPVDATVRNASHLSSIIQALPFCTTSGFSIAPRTPLFPLASLAETDNARSGPTLIVTSIFAPFLRP